MIIEWTAGALVQHNRYYGAFSCTAMNWSGITVAAVVVDIPPNAQFKWLDDEYQFKWLDDGNQFKWVS